MLSQFVGMVDSSAAVVLVAGVLSLAAVLIALLSRRSRHQVQLDYQLETLKATKQAEQYRYQAETDRIGKMKKYELDHDVEIRKTENGMISSHRVMDEQ